MAKKKGKILKVIGSISRQICDDYNIHTYYGDKIVQSLDFYIHVSKHIPDFKTVDTYNNTVLNIEYIIKKPLFVYYDISRNSLLYYSMIDNEYVCLVVKLRNNKNHYVSTVYPISKFKIEKMREKALIVKQKEKEKQTSNQ